MAEPFAALLRRYRARAGLSCNELARGAGVDQSYVSRVEGGTRNPPTRPVVRRLAEALGLQGGDRAALFRAAGYEPDEDLITPLLARLQVCVAEAAEVAAALRAVLPVGAPPSARLQWPSVRAGAAEGRAAWEATVRRMAAGAESED